MVMMPKFNSQERPFEGIRAVYKLFQKLTPEEISQHPDVINFQRGLDDKQQRMCKIVNQIPRDRVESACFGFSSDSFRGSPVSFADVAVFEHEAVPGEESYDTKISSTYKR